MLEKSINRLEYLINIIPQLLIKIGEEELSFKKYANKWSKKEILGHLIDSATNNHQRFIRGQFEQNPEIVYNQDKWNEHSFYQQIDYNQIITFWTIYNKQLIEIINRIPIENLKNQIKVGDKLLSLEFLIIDYVEHLEYHLKQVIEYQ